MAESPAPGRDDTTGAADDVGRAALVARKALLDAADAWTRTWWDTRPRKFEDWLRRRADFAASPAAIDHARTAPAATTGRDELREQMGRAGGVAAMHLENDDMSATEWHPCASCRRPNAPCPCAGEPFLDSAILDAVLSVVDTWVAAHTEQGAEDEGAAALRRYATAKEAQVVQLQANLKAQDEWNAVVSRDLNASRATVARVRALCDKADDMQDIGVGVDHLRAALDPPTKGQT